MFYPEITWLGSTGIATGWDGIEYRPVTPINRDAMAAFLFRLAGEADYEPPAVSPFKDVTTDNMYYREIAWLHETGISTGWSDGTFRPWEPINRDAMAAFLYRLAGEPEWTAPAASPFSDMDSSVQFYDEVTWLHDADITTGWGDGTYRPVTPINRDAMAAYLYRFVDNLGLPQV
ncbi:MAG TPA: S-layer homology domain-containing protein [Propionibacterium sp.]|nr:S-layer homology domain-containing protein [Propionibacterium sp.]